MSKPHISPAEALETEDIEIKLLLEAIYQKYKYDFRSYAFTSIKRRIKHRCARDQHKTITDLTREVLYSKETFSSLLKDFSINVSDMFRDPEVFKTFREKVVPYLNTFPFIRLWVAGCSSGEEVYSLAIILKEEGVYNKCQIYATDMNPLILDVAKEGIYPIDRVAKFTENYQRAGGKESFSDYYNSKFESIIMSKSLKKNIVFSVHNLTVDKVFNEMHFISCRNVMIYFTEELQENVLQLFLDSLYHGGFLCIGTKESLQFTDIHSHFEEVEAHRRIYKNRHV